MNRGQKQIECMDCRRRYKGVGFIKSRKSEFQIMDMAEDMIKASDVKGIKLKELIVDDSSGRDIDRERVDELVQWMEKDEIDAVVIHSIYDISRDNDDLRKFLIKAEELGVSIFSMETKTNLYAGSSADEEVHS